MLNYHGLVKQLDLPAGWKAPAELAYDDIRARAISRADNDADVQGINASIELIRRTRGGNWPAEPVSVEFNYIDEVWHECKFRDGGSFTYAVYDSSGHYLGCCYLYPMGRRVPIQIRVFGIHDLDSLEGREACAFVRQMVAKGDCVNVAVQERAGYQDGSAGWPRGGCPYVIPCCPSVSQSGMGNQARVAGWLDRVAIDTGWPWPAPCGDSCTGGHAVRGAFCACYAGLRLLGVRGWNWFWLTGLGDGVYPWGARRMMRWVCMAARPSLPGLGISWMRWLAVRWRC